MVLICISQIISDVEYLFMYLLVIWISSLKKISVQVLCSFFNWIVCVCVLLLNFITGDNGHPCPVPDFTRKTFSFFSLNMMFSLVQSLSRGRVFVTP